MTLRVDYFLNATDEHLELIGVDRAKLPERETWLATYQEDFKRPLEQRHYYSLVWEVDGQPVGFSSIDQIVFGKQAFFHLHILEAGQRGAGLGAEFVRRSARQYFAALQLQRLYSEPYAYNTAPNRTLQKAGFKYLCTYDTIPGPLNFHQAVNRWMIERPLPVHRESSSSP